MTRPSRSSDSSPCLVRPAQADDRKIIERLVHQFYQSLQLSQLKSINQLSHKAMWMISLGVGALMLVLALHGFYLQIFVLLLFLSIAVLQADRHALKELSNFWIAECKGKVIGCAKLFCYDTHSEAYLVCVDPAWRGQGYGSRLVQRLTEEATLPLYLASQPHRLQFYMRLGFVPLPPDAVPMLVRNRLGIDRFHDYGIVPMVFGRLGGEAEEAREAGDMEEGGEAGVKADGRPLTAES